MKKLNKKKTAWLQRIAAFLLAASIAALATAAAMPMENVRALNENASAKQEADTENEETQDTIESSETSENPETSQPEEIPETSQTEESSPEESDTNEESSEVIRTDLSDEDFEIYLSDANGSEKERFSSFQAWEDYLTAHNNWITDDVYICLTEAGLKYYDSLSLNGAADSSSNSCSINADMPIQEISITAKKYIDGTIISSDAKTFEIGIDKKLPAIENFTASDDFYAPASTGNVRYFPKKFAITGEAFDAGSGIASIEYAVDAKNAAEWIKIEKSEETSEKARFSLELKNGSYDAIALRAIDKAGNISEPVYFKDEAGEFIKVAVDDRPPDIEVFMTADDTPYNADGENWTNKEIKFTICEKPGKDSENTAGIYLVEYAYQSIVPALLGEVPKDGDWHTLETDAEGKACFSIGGDSENPTTKNGYYYFKAISKCGIQNSPYVEKRILLWQNPVPKMPIIQSNADTAKCHNEWYNKESRLPIIDFEYPKYNTDVISGEYSPPVIIHYNLSVEDENKALSFLALNKSASIQTKLPINLSEGKKFESFEIIQDDLSEMQINFPEDGIYTLEYWISDAAGNESEKDVFTYKLDGAGNMAEGWSCGIVVDNEAPIGDGALEMIKGAHTFEGSNVQISVRAVDRSGNESSCSRELKIDVTKPEIDISFDSENALNGSYYNSARRAEIKINELNFDASLVEINVTKDGKPFFPAVSPWQSENNNHTAYVDFTEDGDYGISVKCRDLADNDADRAAAAHFTIDTTQPRASIMLENGGQNEYFSRTQTAVITVVEHNFDVKDFKINMKPAGTIGAWKHRGDSHSIKVYFLAEGECSLSCEYKDLAGNDIAGEDKTAMPIEFVIDTALPEITISGVENNSANAGAVVPVITVLDKNIELAGSQITLATGRGKEVDISADISAALAEGGFAYTLNGLDAKADDIYYLEITASDKAQNTSKALCRFSLNRRGSSYDVTGFDKIAKKYYNSHNTLEDIKIIEMNIDKVEDFEIYLSHNADIIYGAKGGRPKDAGKNKLPASAFYDVTVSGDEDTGYVYTYTLYRENFALEGAYRLGIYSKDRAGNEVNNLLELNGEEIQFIIDNTAPSVVIEGVEDNEVYNVETQKAHVSAQDNFKLASAEIILVNRDGEVLESWDYFDLAQKEGDIVAIAIGEHDEELSLLYRATDEAGNEVYTSQEEKAAKTDFLVTASKVIQFINKPEKTPIGRFTVFSLSGIAGLVLMAVYAAFMKKYR